MNPEELQKHFTLLYERTGVLACLYAAGVDSWEGYDEAMEMRDEADT